MTDTSHWRNRDKIWTMREQISKHVLNRILIYRNIWEGTSSPLLFSPVLCVLFNKYKSINIFVDELAWKIGSDIFIADWPYLGFFSWLISLSYSKKQWNSNRFYGIYFHLHRNCMLLRKKRDLTAFVPKRKREPNRISNNLDGLMLIWYINRTRSISNTHTYRLSNLPSCLQLCVAWWSLNSISKAHARVIRRAQTTNNGQPCNCEEQHFYFDSIVRWLYDLKPRGSTDQTHSHVWVCVVYVTGGELV